MAPAALSAASWRFAHSSSRASSRAAPKIVTASRAVAPRGDALRSRCPPSSSDAALAQSFRMNGPNRRSRGRPVRYKESEVEGEVNDWRIKQMCQIAHRYYAELWSKGSMSAADEILGEDIQLNDELWASHPFVGRETLKKQVLHFRQLYPDLVMEIDDIGVYGTQDLAIRWSARGTNLGGPHPTHHYTKFSGVSSLHFSNDRKRVESVTCYRQPTSEEMTKQCDITWRREPSTTEIQLVPLHVSTANYDYLPDLNKKAKGKN